MQEDDPVEETSQEHAVIHHAENIPPDDTNAYLSRVILISARYIEAHSLWRTEQLSCQRHGHSFAIIVYP